MYIFIVADAGGLYQVGTFPSWNRWAEWNGRYRDELRRYLKGDEGQAQLAAERIAGSRDMYATCGRTNASVNFITCHDGFTLYDLYAYNEKHNLKNGWNNTDGTSCNDSWNCGVEGDTDRQDVLNLRMRMIRNAFTLLMCSRGTPMFLAGDEFCNTQFGNNNAYCQDNITSWLDWSLLQKNQKMFRFFRFMIRFRKSHRLLRKPCRDIAASGFPDISFHGVTPWREEPFAGYDRYIGVMYTGWEKNIGPHAIYIASNAWHEGLQVELPTLPSSMRWKVAVDTWDYEQPKDRFVHGDHIYINSRSVMVLVGR